MKSLAIIWFLKDWNKKTFELRLEGFYFAQAGRFIPAY